MSGDASGTSHHPSAGRDSSRPQSPGRSIVSPDDQPATFVELFFDLVFVFSITQLVGLLHEGLAWEPVVESVLVFWLIWWAWTQFTWALNAADTEHPLVELVTLAGTAVAFLMAITVPDAFRGGALWFAVPYVVVRILALWLYAKVARANHPAHHAAVRTFALVSVTGLLSALAGAALGGALQYWLWSLTIVLDVVAAMIGGREEYWDIHPEHFTERHGLFVIIALGETLIVAAAGLTGADWTPALVLIAVLAVGTSCSLWWSYFPGPRPALERGLAATPAAEHGSVARDAFSLLHFPMLCGIVAFAVAVEEAVAHPTSAFPLGARVALALTPLLFVGGTALAVRRATGRTLGLRLALCAVTAAAVIGLTGIQPAVHLTLTLAGVVALLLLERWPETEWAVTSKESA